MGGKDGEAKSKSRNTRNPSSQGNVKPSIPPSSVAATAGAERTSPDKQRYPPRVSSQISPVKLLRKAVPRMPSNSMQDSGASQSSLFTDISRLSLSSGNSTQDGTPDTGSLRDSANSISIPPTQSLPRQRHIRDPSATIPQPSSAELSDTTRRASYINGKTPSRPINGSLSPPPREDSQYKLQYFHDPYANTSKRQQAAMRASSTALPLPPTLGMEHSNRSLPELRVVSDGLRAPDAALLPMSAVDPEQRGRDHSRHLSVGGLSPNRLSAVHQGRSLSTQRYSPDSRPQSYIDMLQHIPYQQQLAPTNTMMSNSFLRSAVGSNASLLDNRKTLEMYRANVKNINEPAIQYEFAIFMVQTAMECTEPNDRADMLRESKAILQKLADRSYPFAQYYLGDGYASGLFNKGKEDHDRAFPLFVAASKHGHAEAGYRAALCYEFGWGCRRDYAKAVQFFRASASKNHPGAATRLGLACLQQTMGMIGKYKQGVSYLKRAAESADAQYNAGPYELARLHETGFGDDIFKDESYAAQLYTRSAELGHADANLVLGKAYEHGLLNCPKDAGLSIHFYTGAAQSGIPEAMMALCAWYLFGAEPVLEKNENEAFEWAKQAADLGFAKAEYAIGYFKEVGIGCRQDSLDANAWYVRAAQQGEERAKARLAIIRNAASGGGPDTAKVVSSEDGVTKKKGLFSRFA